MLLSTPGCIAEGRCLPRHIRALQRFPEEFGHVGTVRSAWKSSTREADRQDRAARSPHSEHLHPNPIAKCCAKWGSGVEDGMHTGDVIAQLYSDHRMRIAPPIVDSLESSGCLAHPSLDEQGEMLCFG